MIARRSAALVVALVFAIAADAAAQRPEDLEPAPREGDRVGWYTVEDGDTLSAITARTLGTARLWRENWRLNPSVRDPDLLSVGTRLRIIEHRETPERSAEVAAVVRTVQQRTRQEPTWKDAAVGNLLRAEDALQTRRRSSAELLFDDGTELRVTESTLLFLRAVGRRLTGVTEQTIEIERGGAELTLAPARADSTDVEVIVGDARARPATGRTGRAHSRLRREDDGATISVFDGSSEVEASGGTVDVPRGAGTRVDPGRPPTPPEPLPPAPEPLAPTRDQQLAWANPEFSWSGPEGATAWEIEVCLDPTCARLADRADALTSPRWRPEQPLPTGTLYWRARARSSTGLDGFPNRAVRFAVTDPRADLEPPSVAIAIDEPGREHPERRVFLGRDGALRPRITDDVAGVETIRFRWDDGPWIRYRSGALGAPSDGDRHLLDLEATDTSGKVAGPVRYIVQRLLEPPPPPTLEVRPPP